MFVYNCVCVCLCVCVCVCVCTHICNCHTSSSDEEEIEEEEIKHMNPLSALDERFQAEKEALLAKLKGKQCY